MSTEATWQIESTNLDDTLAIAERIGTKLRGGEVIELTSDLGGGKTAFTKGLAKGMDSTDTVHSPSFTLCDQYQGSELVIYHFDFYRLSEPGIMRQELAEAVADPKGVVVVEWADIVEDVLPIERLSIQITVTGETTRRFSCTYPQTLAYLLDQGI